MARQTRYSAAQALCLILAADESDDDSSAGFSSSDDDHVSEPSDISDTDTVAEDNTVEIEHPVPAQGVLRAQEILRGKNGTVWSRIPPAAGRRRNQDIVRGHPGITNEARCETLETLWNGRWLTLQKSRLLWVSVLLVAFRNRTMNLSLPSGLKLKEDPSDYSSHDRHDCA